MKLLKHPHFGSISDWFTPGPRWQKGWCCAPWWILDNIWRSRARRNSEKNDRSPNLSKWCPLLCGIVRCHVVADYSQTVSIAKRSLAVVKLSDSLPLSSCFPSLLVGVSRSRHKSNLKFTWSRIPIQKRQRSVRRRSVRVQHSCEWTRVDPTRQQTISSCDWIVALIKTGSRHICRHDNLVITYRICFSHFVADVVVVC